VSVITDISLDHQKFLGNTVAEIAIEKAGIIRPGGIVVTLPQQPAANDVIGNAVLELGAEAVSAVPYVPPVSPGAEGLVAGSASRGVGESALASRYRLQVMGEEILVESPLVGRHQLRNVALAIATAEELAKQGWGRITAQTIARGIRETHWPGRFQALPAAQGRPEMVFDVAHNPAGAWALRSSLSAVYPERRLVFVFGAMRDKAVSEMAEILFALAERVIATHANNPRAATPEEIRQAAGRVSVELEEAADVASALKRALAVAGQDGLVVVTGSIYVVGDAMRLMGARI
jgi:dihydrofolate synthase/folylpolyglutamate synthase